MCVVLCCVDSLLKALPLPVVAAGFAHKESECACKRFLCVCSGGKKQHRERLLLLPFVAVYTHIHTGHALSQSSIAHTHHLPKEQASQAH